MPTEVETKERPVFTPMEVARLLGLSKNTTYEALARGEIPSIRVGRRILVSKAALERLLAGEKPSNGQAGQ
ncbi:MAG TPA: helix-turn-helix domain-containing protein [Dehalococcoidia bacterium]|nr:helix-turn-helix domain-containing protein [Dehalococcoidia bacterium]